MNWYSHRLGRYLDRLSKLTIFHTFILSNFNFCPLAWHFCTDKNSQKLEKVQERALRFVVLYTNLHVFVKSLLPNRKYLKFIWISLLKRLGRYLDKLSKLTIFHTFILGNFNFCPLAWHFCTDKNSYKSSCFCQKSSSQPQVPEIYLD
jgi:hypothetical protein